MNRSKQKYRKEVYQRLSIELYKNCQKNVKYLFLLLINMVEKKLNNPNMPLLEINEEIKRTKELLFWDLEYAVNIKSLFELIKHETQNTLLIKIIEILEWVPQHFNWFVHLRKQSKGWAWQNRLEYDKSVKTWNFVHETEVATHEIEFKSWKMERQSRESESVYETIIHELLHKYTSLVFNQPESSLSKSEKKYKSNINQLHSKFMLQYWQFPHANDINEFVVRVLTNESWMKMANELWIYDDCFKLFKNYINSSTRVFRSNDPFLQFEI